jgi:hypothetical protein
VAGEPRLIHPDAVEVEIRGVDATRRIHHIIKPSIRATA